MVIGIDARELCGKPTGVGRYLATLLREWGRMADARRHRFVLYTPSAVPVPGSSPDWETLPHEWRRVPGAGGTLWEQRDLPRALEADRPDVLFAPAYTAPLAVTLPVVLTIHDLSYMARPEWFGWRERLRRSWLTRRSARRAHAILTDSRFSRNEILRLLGVPAERVQVVHLGVPPRPGAGDDVPREPLVLFVGSIFNRRRVPDLISAFDRVARALPEARLEIVGDDRTFPKQDLGAAIAGAAARERIRLHAYVSDRTLTDLYARASVFAFLSEYEGFGLTPLEALSHGVPLVVVDTEVAREVYGGAAAYVAAGDVAGTADALERLLTDEGARQALLAHAPATLGRYSWERAARETLMVIEEAAAETTPGVISPGRAGGPRQS